MQGYLDERNQAFLTLDFGQGPLDFEIDTGFDGTLVVGEELFDPAQTTPAGFAEADEVKADRYGLGKKKYHPQGAAEFFSQSAGDEVIVSAAFYPDIGGNGRQ